MVNMQALVTTSPDINLRPIPGPDPVALPTSDWWLWLVPIVLIGFLWYWWTRKQIKTELTAQQRLDLALSESENIELDPKARYQLLHHAFRDYLAEYDPKWKSLTANETLAAWQNIFPDRLDLVNLVHDQWVEAEALLYGPEKITDNEVAAYVLHVGKINTELVAAKNEKSENSSGNEPNRNKIPVSNE